MKKTLRDTLLQKRDLLDPAERKRMSETVCRSLLGLSCYDSAQTVMAFMSFRSEIETALAVRHILESGRRLILPVADREAGTLRLSLVKDLRDLSPGAFGILEPRPEAFIAAGPTDPDLILVPGACFDYKGFRIGYGGGYYDRFLPSARKDALFIGLCFDFQIVPNAWPESHDKPVDLVLSEKRMIKRKASIGSL